MDTRVSVFPDNEAAIRSLAGFVTNYRIVRNCRRCVDLLSGLFSVSPVFVTGWCPPSDVLFNQLGYASVKLAIARKFFRDANLS